MLNPNLQSILAKRNNHRPLIFNMVLWLFFFVILLFIFSKGHKPIFADYIYTIGFLIVVAIPANINFYILIPKFLKKEYYKLYGLLVLLLGFGFAALCSLYFNVILNLIFKYYFFVSYLSSFKMFVVFIAILFITTLLKLTEDWLYFNANENKLLKIQNQQIQTQLLALRGQMNPHFLFNSLNVIYAMALENKNEITEAIVQLSDVLRYVIYDSDTERVNLKDEKKLIKNYIEFQKYRGHSNQSIEFISEIENPDYKIYPMLLLPLIENAFKFGITEIESTELISITMSQKGTEFKFTIKNAILINENLTPEKHAGVGLKNIENNLQLVYPNRHNFEIIKEQKSFCVKLSINNE